MCAMQLDAADVWIVLRAENVNMLLIEALEAKVWSSMQWQDVD